MTYADAMAIIHNPGINSRETVRQACHHIGGDSFEPGCDRPANIPVCDHQSNIRTAFVIRAAIGAKFQHGE